MTFREKIRQYLGETIYFESQLNQIMEAIEKDKLIEDIWNRDVDGYPDEMIGLVMCIINLFVLNWIKVNNPEHFLIPFFENQKQIEKLLEDLKIQERKSKFWVNVVSGILAILAVAAIYFAFLG